MIDNRNCYYYFVYCDS